MLSRRKPLCKVQVPTKKEALGVRRHLYVEFSTFISATDVPGWRYAVSTCCFVIYCYNVDLSDPPDINRGV